MLLFAASGWMHFLLGALMFITALFLILLVLVQRGRGGGLTGALGGMGGQSAFGTKAGDVFTRITIVTAGVWILTCMLAIKLLEAPKLFGTATSGGSAVESSATPGTEGDKATTGGVTPEVPPATDTKSGSGAAAPASTTSASTPATGTAASPESSKTSDK